MANEDLKDAGLIRCAVELAGLILANGLDRTPIQRATALATRIAALSTGCTAFGVDEEGDPFSVFVPTATDVDSTLDGIMCMSTVLSIFHGDLDPDDLLDREHCGRYDPGQGDDE